MFGNPHESSRKSEYSADESSYGGFESRFRYEDYCRARSAPLRRRLLMGMMLIVALGVTGAFSGYLAFQITKMNSGFYYPASAYPTDTSIREADSSAHSNSVLPAESTAIPLRVDDTVYAETITPDVSERYRIPRGVLVKTISASSAAYRAGLRAGDIIVAADGTEIPDLETLNQRTSHFPESPVRLTVFRDNGYRDITVSANS